ncbi:acyl-CoA dehydratase activase [candidate division KSB1 bacterium]
MNSRNEISDKSVGVTDMNLVYSAGIDIGSTTAKAVVLDNDNAVVFSEYLRHNAKIDLTLLEILEKLLDTAGNIKLNLSITGSAGIGISELLGIPFTQEVIASAAAVEMFYPDTKVLIDVGGEDTKMIFFHDKRRPDIRMNGNCAGGTGAFIDQMSVLMNISIEELDRLALDHKRIYPIASRCGVFAKTDVQSLLGSQVPKTDIAASIFHAVALQTVTSLTRGRDIIPGILLCGGPLSFIKSLRHAFQDVLCKSDGDILLPEKPELMSAFGASLGDDHTEYVIYVKDLINLIRSSKRKVVQDDAGTLEPLFNSGADFSNWLKDKEKYKANRNNIAKLEDEDAFLGIDSGSTTTKIVLINKDEEIVFTYYSNNNGEPIEAVKTGLEELKSLLEENNIHLKIGNSAVTGYGEDLIRAAFAVDSGYVETLAHYRAAKCFNKDVSFVLDIGGQDMKAIFIKSGTIHNIEINEACSSGCGSFIETFARSIGSGVKEFADQACRSSTPCDLGTRCTVFMNSKVKQFFREGSPVEDIAAGLAYSVIKNCLNKVLKIRDIDDLGENIVVQGGTFKNPAVLRALEKTVNRKVIRPDISELMGAYGAALMALDEYKDVSEITSSFVGFSDLSEVDNYKLKDAGCGGCENNCDIKIIRYFSGKRYFTGNRCEKIYNNSGKSVSKGENLYEFKYDLLFNRKMIPDSKPVAVIGIPRILNMFENFPFWCSLFVEAGIEVRLSSHSSIELLEKGTNTVMSDNICFPAKLAHGHIFDLIDNGIDRIFFPMVKYEKIEFRDSVNHFNCPVVTGYPDVIASSIDPESAGVKFDKPLIVFNDEKMLKKACYDYLKVFNIGRRVFNKAFQKALSAQKDFKVSLESAGRRILEEAEKNNKQVVLLAGRPYHADPVVNHDIPEIISGFGVDVITDEAIPALEKEGMKGVEVLSQWEYSNRLYNAANWAGKKKNILFVQLNSFGCGPDAITMDEVKDILNQYGKSNTLIRIDEITSKGAVKLRLRSMLESLDIERIENQGSSFIPRLTTPPFTEIDKGKTIISADFSPFYSPFIESLFSAIGHKMELLPPSNKESVEIGLKYTNNDICYPAVIFIGDILKALMSGKYDPKNTVAGITETGGQCRASNYASLLKKALIAAGFTDVPVVTMATCNSSLNHQPGFNIDRKRLISLTLSSLLYVDTILKMYYAAAVREKFKGEALRLTEKYLNTGRKMFRGYTLKNCFDLLEKAVSDFNRIEVNEEDYPRVGIVGEIYMKYNPFGNDNLTGWLMDNGIEVVVPPMISFFLEWFVDVDFNRKNHLDRTSIPVRILAAGFEKVLDGQISRVNSILEKFKIPVTPTHRIRDLSKKADNIASLIHQFGEGWTLPAEVAAMAQHGISNVVCVQPFACIANHIVAKGIEKALKRDYNDLNMLFLDMDAGGCQTNIQNRLQFFIRGAKNSLEQDRPA